MFPVMTNNEYSSHLLLYLLEMENIQGVDYLHIDSLYANINGLLHSRWMSVDNFLLKIIDHEQSIVGFMPFPMV